MSQRPEPVPIPGGVILVSAQQCPHAAIQRVGPAVITGLERSRDGQQVSTRVLPRWLLADRHRGYRLQRRVVLPAGKLVAALPQLTARGFERRRGLVQGDGIVDQRLGIAGVPVGGGCQLGRVGAQLLDQRPMRRAAPQARLGAGQQHVRALSQLSGEGARPAGSRPEPHRIAGRHSMRQAELRRG